MIFTKSDDKLFAFDILLHSFFSFTVITIIFIFITRKQRQKELAERFEDVFEEKGVLGSSSITETEKSDLQNFSSNFTCI